jgi:hypothetical protein
MPGRPILLSDHAREELGRRGLDPAMVLAVAAKPEQTEVVRGEREVRQSQVRFPPHEDLYLVRVITDRLPDQDLVVTAYRTSKIEKYWRKP